VICCLTALLNYNHIRKSVIIPWKSKRIRLAAV
jgi:hypothetical protein